ncbi:MAG: hypothetical protein C7B46_12915 [Sulfobacillus benefaciens]|uniref:MFS transporter n=1 Tax=Sulfobacillus benefaciens TaxID=453960 RepID=A0A2T2XDX3_9FIRM|nr:MAG: hypothetical protein C7B46_12915 [Sulfobacillus benefaciens]
MTISTSPPSQKFWVHRPFWILSLAIFLNAFSYGVAAVSTTWLAQHSAWSLWHLTWAPTGLIIGILSGGITADHIGRTRLLHWSPVGYVIGGLILLVVKSHSLSAWGCLALVITAGLESTTVLALGQELLPPSTRTSAFYLMMNFSNFGGLVLAILTAMPMHPGVRQTVITLIPVILAILSWQLRRKLPESPEWFHARAPKPTSSKPFYLTSRFATSVIFSYTNATSFALVTYALGVKIYPQLLPRFLMLSTGGAFIAGLASPLFAKLPVSTLLLGSYGGTWLFALALWAYPTIHWALWLGLSVATGVAFLAENEFKTSAWPSKIRGRVTAWERVGGQLGYLGTLIAVQHFSFPQLTLALAGIWAMGAGAALWWRIFSSGDGARQE